MRYWLFVFMLMIAVMLFISLYVAPRYAHDDFAQQIRLPQNALQWVNPKTAHQLLLTSIKQQRYAKRYLHLYFLPWTLNDRLVFVWYKISHGIPFLTLLYLPGHIVTYIGSDKNHPVIFQTVWGAHSRTWYGEKDRAIIGATVITRADMGRQDLNIPTTWLDRMTQMAVFSSYTARRHNLRF